MLSKHIAILTLFVLTLVYEVSLTVIDQQKVCTRVEKYNTTVTVSEQKPVRVREFVWCLAVPPRCSRYVTKIKKIERNETIEKTRSKAICCKGFQETPDKKKCTPICSQGCVHGHCEAPDTCVCIDNFGGPDCSSTCPEGKWGAQCNQSCDCYNGGFCDPIQGTCKCLPGFTGEHCHLECQSGTYGNNCTQRCLCRKNSQCNPSNGTCSCDRGWTGRFCERIVVRTNKRVSYRPN